MNFFVEAWDHGLLVCGARMKTKSSERSGNAQCIFRVEKDLDDGLDLNVFPLRSTA